MSMDISYNITLKITDKTGFQGTTFNKDFNYTINKSGDYLYNNDHLIANDVKLLTLFENEVQAYLDAHGIKIGSIVIDECDIVSRTDRVDVYFTNEIQPARKKGRDGEYTPVVDDFSPTIMAFVWPKEDLIEMPVLKGKAYDSNSIIWSWPADEEYGHYLLSEPADPFNEDEKDKIIAQLPIGQHTYVETDLQPGTEYTRVLINYTADRTSVPSNACTVTTAKATAAIAVSDYKVDKEYDFTTDDTDREYIDDRMQAFHPGIGDFNDLKAYKQMDADFYQKFSAYLELSGRRFQREARYDQVGFNYKVDLEAKQRVEEQKGEVTYDLTAYPREWVVCRDYMFAKAPLEFNAQIKGQFLAYKNDSKTEALDYTIDQIKYHEKRWKDPDTYKYDTDPLYLALCFDTSGSMNWNLDGTQKSPVCAKKDRRCYLLYKALRDGLCPPLNQMIANGVDIYIGITTFAGHPAYTGDDYGPQWMCQGFTKTQYVSAEDIMNKAYNHWNHDNLLSWDSDTKGTCKFNDGYNGQRTNYAAGCKNLHQLCDTSLSSIPNKSLITLFFSDGYCNKGIENYQGFNEHGKPGDILDNNGRESQLIRHLSDTFEEFRDKFASKLYKTHFVLLEQGQFDSNGCHEDNGYIYHARTVDLMSKIIASQIKVSYVDDGQHNGLNRAVDQNMNKRYEGKVFYCENEEKLEKAFTSIATINRTRIPGKQHSSNSTKRESTPYSGNINIPIDIHSYKWFNFKTQPIPIHIPISAMDDIEYIWKEDRASNLYWYYKNDHIPIWTQVVAAINAALNQSGTGGWTPLKNNNNNYVLHNVTVQDTFKISDEDVPANLLFNSGFEDGRKGSFDCFLEWKAASINTPTFSDDVYFLDSSSKLIVTGTTDACIYDHTRFVNLELNAYDHPDDIILSQNEDYSSMLHNRRVKTATYDQTTGYNKKEIVHVITVLQRDRDTWIGNPLNDNTGTQLSSNYSDGPKYTHYPELQNGHINNPDNVEDDVAIYQFSTATGALHKLHNDNLDYYGNGGYQYKKFPAEENGKKYDITCHISRFYKSPVLNYVFNLEDCDARVPMNHIMPAMDKECPFPHVVMIHVYYARNVWVRQLGDDDHTAYYIESYGNDPNVEDNIKRASDPPTHYADHEFYAMQPSSPPVVPSYVPAVDPAGKNMQGILMFDRKQWQHQANAYNNMVNPLSTPVPTSIRTGSENGWWYDSYIWFMAKPMIEERDYFDTVPGEGMNTLYGMVNGRYVDTYSNGKQDLRVDTPQFNMPNNIIDETVRISIRVTEYNPSEAIVSYKWDHPWINPATNKEADDVTQVNGDYVTFSSDTITYKDVPYIDKVLTQSYQNIELFDNKTIEQKLEIQKPDTLYDYQNWYVEVKTDNSDVLALRYPKEIIFDSNGKAEILAAFKGVVGATSKWSPRIHNGYYYLNQHEYYAYSEFDVDAEFDTISEENYKTTMAYVSVTTTLEKPGIGPVTQTIEKDSRSKLLQNEDLFVWIEGKGLTLKPIVDGLYYKEYIGTEYISPVFIFDHELISIEDAHFHSDPAWDSTDPSCLIQNVMYRSYDLDNGCWRDWEDASTITQLSYAYQFKCNMFAAVTYEDIEVRKDISCYNNFKDDCEQDNSYNVTYNADYLTTIPGMGDGEYVSKIFDLGTEDSYVQFWWFESEYVNNVTVYVAVGNTYENVILANCAWNVYTQYDKHKGRYFRYKIVIPADEKLYYIFKNVYTKKSNVTLPYIQSIMIKGTWKTDPTRAQFQNVESFEIPSDAQPHKVIDNIWDNVIGSDILQMDYTKDQVVNFEVKSVADGVKISNEPITDVDSYVEVETLDEDIEIITTNTPYIWAEITNGMAFDYEVIKIHGTPQQYCPITVEAEDGTPLHRTYNEKMFTEPLGIIEHNSTISFFSGCKQETHIIKDEGKYIYLNDNSYEKDVFTDADGIKRYSSVIIQINDGPLYEASPEREGTWNNIESFVNHIIIFKEPLKTGDVVDLYYMQPERFYAIIDRKKDTTELWIYRNHRYNSSLTDRHKYKVYFETSKRNNKFVAKRLSLNPIYRTDYDGFIYLTDTHNQPFKLKLYCNPTVLTKGGYDKVDMQFEVLDMLDNPVIHKKVDVDCLAGGIKCDDFYTDMNGVVHIIYQSSVEESIDTVKATVYDDDGNSISASINIENK